MAKLDYHTPQRTTSKDTALPLMYLIFAPFAPLGSVLLGWVHWLDEPFGNVRLFDIAVFAGSPCLIIILAIVWSWLARRQRMPWFACLPLLAWFAWTTYLSIQLLVPYFDEPWNY